MDTKEMIAVMQAAIDGKPIQYRRKGDIDWKVASPHWNWDGCEYRVKPEPKYRPFRDAAEFKPHRERWLTWKCGGNAISRVVGVNTSMVWIGTETRGRIWADAFRVVEFDDGSPFGVRDAD